MPSTAETAVVSEPIPIYKLAQRYLVYDANAVSYLRREHNICGVLIGGLAQAPQQNVFSGLPLELLPEEARLLVEKRVAYVVDDVSTHRRAFLENGLGAEERKAYQAALRKQGLAAASEDARRRDRRKKVGMKQRSETENWNDLPEDILKPRSDRGGSGRSAVETNAEPDDYHEDETLFSTPASTPSLRKASASSEARSAEAGSYAVTPTTSYHPLQSSTSPFESESQSGKWEIPDAPQSYPIFRYLHDQGYFLAPGLRFGCQYMAYPGDPLRFHSHFLVNGLDWDQEFDLLDLVAGGRLGTGVKKGFLLGGLEEASAGGRGQGSGESGDETRVGARSFCIEWGGM